MLSKNYFYNLLFLSSICFSMMDLNNGSLMTLSPTDVYFQIENESYGIKNTGLSLVKDHNNDTFDLKGKYIPTFAMLNAIKVINYKLFIIHKIGTPVPINISIKAENYQFEINDLDKNSTYSLKVLFQYGNVTINQFSVTLTFKYEKKPKCIEKGLMCFPMRDQNNGSLTILTPYDMLCKMGKNTIYGMKIFALKVWKISGITYSLYGKLLPDISLNTNYSLKYTLYIFKNGTFITVIKNKSINMTGKEQYTIAIGKLKQPTTYYLRVSLYHENDTTKLFSLIQKFKYPILPKCIGKDPILPKCIEKDPILPKCIEKGFIGSDVKHLDTVRENSMTFQNDSIYGPRFLTIEPIDKYVQGSIDIAARFLIPKSERTIKYFICTLKKIGRNYTQTQNLVYKSRKEEYQFDFENLDRNSIYYINIGTKYENDIINHISSSRTFKSQDELIGRIEFSNFYDATIYKVRRITLKDGLAIQVFWNSTVRTKNTLFCVSMDSTYPGNVSKKATIWGETSHIFLKAITNNEYRLSLWVSALCQFEENDKYQTKHQGICD
ncbi:uncharacterized protein LOC135929798 isoform X2 [Gordionus sp. m RMFG-2023]|uniref:uncharacterized protein LOC135929798 isoform X2 n=1 Tax=Gordionus sp. m RMFG-2023 TaxID=3053472 RepID=UPI0031FCB4CD